jgi:aspartate/methionine/tyrosine aminotransferase
LSLGDRLLSWFTRREGQSFSARRDVWDKVKWRWNVGLLLGELGLANTLRDILPESPSPDGFIGPQGFSLDTQFGWTGQPNGSYWDLKDRVIENFRFKVPVGNVSLYCGAQHANYCVITGLLAPGEKVVIPKPSWMQYEPLCYSMGAEVEVIPLREELGWKWDMDELNEAVSSDTKMILMCNPNNPTGRLYDLNELKTIVEIAQDARAFVLSDESFRGLELDAPSMSSTPVANIYYSGVSTGSMSKPFTADGVRVGWTATRNKEIQTRADRVQAISVEHVGGISVMIAWAANDPKTFRKIVSKHREDAIAKREVLSKWMDKQSFFTSWVKADCGYLSFPGWTHDIDSVAFLDAAWEAKKIAFMSGALYGVEKHVRFGTGRCTMKEFKESLNRLNEFLEKYL